MSVAELQNCPNGAMETLAQHGKAVEHYLSSLRGRYPNAPARLLDAIDYSLLAGGKRLRPALVLETAWDSESDATEFVDAAQTAVEGLADDSRISAPGGSRVTILIASDPETLLALDVVFGSTGV